MAATKKFKAHMMYNPKTGKGSMANKMADHLRMKKLGYGHTKPKKRNDMNAIYNSRGVKVPGMYKKGGSTAAWTRKEGKDPKGGLNAKGVASYRKENPGSKLQTAVTTKPSKLKPGSKSAKRRKSFCARMSGVKGPMKKPNGKPTRKALALRKWNC